MGVSKHVLLKVIVLGDAGVGKTCLINRFVNKKFSERYQATIGADFLEKNVVINGRPVTMQIWDTAGQELFHSLGTLFYRKADCCLLVFDVTDLKSFESLDGWRNEFLVKTEPKDPEQFPFVLLGNKVDLPTRAVSSELALKWAKGMRLRYYETSAKNSRNVQHAFECIAHCALSRLPKDNNSEIRDGIKLTRNTKSKKVCCLH